ncbi:hypothetical protein Q1J52_02370 [Pseudomonas lijiangensis]|uniref:hypothetical protein n=1 Tax=Pseudomonas syringae group TaxID=136849 RepID=UPI001910E187|nr:hypothetical protein [Pseudomonas cichorii]GFM64079.1 hypothetical protein PSCICJ_01970 [Pseudomonas cichorii]
MFSSRIVVTGLCFCFGVSSAALAADMPDVHQTAVTALAIGQHCKKMDPTSPSSIDNLLLDKSITGELRAEILKMNNNPSYKAEVDMIEITISNSKIWSIAKDVCKGYLPPVKS